LLRQDVRYHGANQEKNRMGQQKRGWRREMGAATLMGLGCLIACAPAFDSSRPPAPSRSLGAHVYEVLCQRLAKDAYPEDSTGRLSQSICRDGARPAPGAAAALHALHAERPRLLQAIDHAMSSDEDPSLRADLAAALPGWLDLLGSTPLQQQATAVHTGLRALRDSPAGLELLAAPGMQPLRPQWDPRGGTAGMGLGAALISSAAFPELLGASLRQLEDPTRLAGARLSSWQRSLQQQLTTQKTSPFGALGPLSAFLLRPQPGVVGDPQPHYVVARHADGSWRHRQPAAPVPQAILPPPFGPSGAANHDPFGRPQGAEGRLLYHYQEVGSSPLAGVLQQVRHLAGQAPEALHGGVRVLAALLDDAPSTGAATPTASQRAAPLANALGGAPLVQLIDALQQATAASDPALWRRAAGWLAQVGAANEGLFAQLASLKVAGGAGPVDPAVAAGTAALTDEVVDWWIGAADVPGLLEDVVQAFASPSLRALGPTLAQQLRYRDGIEYDLRDLNGPPLGEYLTPVDRQQPAVAGNASVFRRLLELVHDSRQPLCNPSFEFVSKTYARCEFFRIDDAAVFYLRAMVGQAHLTLRFSEEDEAMRAMLEEVKDNQSSAVIGFDHAFLLPAASLTAADRAACTGGPDADYTCMSFNVTPPAASRMLFAVHDPRVDEGALDGTISLMRQISEDMQIDGQSIGQVHPATLFAWEKDGFAGRIAPLVAAFVKHHQEAKLLDLLGIVHRHWGAGARLGDTEQGLAHLLDEQGVLQQVGRLCRLAEDSRFGARRGTEVLLAALRQLSLPVPPAAGDARPASLPRRADGTPVFQPRLLHWLVDVGRQADQALDGPAGAEPASPRLQEQVFTALWGTEPTPEGGRAFVNGPAYRLLLAGLGALAQSAPLPATEIADLVRQPVVQQSLGLMVALADDPDIRAASLSLVRELLGGHFDASLAAAAQAVQQLGDAVDRQPLWDALAAWNVPQTGPISQSLPLLHRLWTHDPQGVLRRLLVAWHRPMEGICGDASPFAAGQQVAARLGRLDPGATTPLTAADYDRILAGLQDFLQDKHHGLGRVIDLMEMRP
jgi:hypothetical protein